MSTMSDLATYAGNPAALIAEWRERAGSVGPLGPSPLHIAADELEAVLDGYALVPADDPSIDRTSSASRQHFVDTGRFLTVSESMAVTP